MVILIFSKMLKGTTPPVEKFYSLLYQKDSLTYLQFLNRDYAENERLDNYESEGVDDQHYEPLDLGARNALDNNLNRRDNEIRRREGRVAGAFIYGLDDDQNDNVPAVRRHRHIYDAQEVDQDEDGVVSFFLFLTI